jgi:DNA-binding Lrp family transcriptional regulator
MASMDDTDRLIVEALRADGRLSMRALAERLHISRANAYTRVARLEREGVILGYAALINPVRYGYALSAYVYLAIAQRSWKSVRAQLLLVPEVDHVALVSGAHDIVLRVRARDAVSLRDVVLTRLQEIPEVRATQTVLIFDEVEPPGVPLAPDLLEAGRHHDRGAAARIGEQPNRGAHSSPENRSHADCLVIWRAAPMRAQVTRRSRKMVTSRWRPASVWTPTAAMRGSNSRICSSVIASSQAGNCVAGSDGLRCSSLRM